MPAEESRETWQCDPGSWGVAGEKPDSLPLGQKVETPGTDLNSLKNKGSGGFQADLNIWGIASI